MKDPIYVIRHNKDNKYLAIGSVMAYTSNSDHARKYYKKDEAESFIRRNFSYDIGQYLVVGELI